MTLRRTTLALLILYALLTIYPIVSIVAGVAPSPYITPVSTLAGFAFALLHAGQREGWDACPAPAGAGLWRQPAFRKRRRGHRAGLRSISLHQQTRPSFSSGWSRISSRWPGS